MEEELQTPTNQIRRQSQEGHCSPRPPADLSGEIKQMACNMDTQKSSAFRFKISYEVEGLGERRCQQLLAPLSWRLQLMGVWLQEKPV